MTVYIEEINQLRALLHVIVSFHKLNQLIGFTSAYIQSEREN